MKYQVVNFGHECDDQNCCRTIEKSICAKSKHCSFDEPCLQVRAAALMSAAYKCALLFEEIQSTSSPLCSLGLLLQPSTRLHLLLSSPLPPLAQQVQALQISWKSYCFLVSMKKCTVYTTNYPARTVPEFLVHLA